ncbi:hypothetical protein FACS1894172_15560 [Spirochaetia bacterium]|nr:hypothetical protein FACS1894164_04190 [Spirochaetia bacterium]GHU34790.1 hypothetical protein FACS1894172_15560 [Spirochaetia bacterium]
MPKEKRSKAEESLAMPDDPESTTKEQESTAEESLAMPKDSESTTMRIENPGLKNRKIFLTDGSIGQFDGEGFIEVSIENSVHLLLIPGFGRVHDTGDLAEK